ncbi:MAG TPA: DNA methyltransferase, partial [Bacteroidota bacterium]|nr:DNA methyltransferase [Bacteroidota bacterium]
MMITDLQEPAAFPVIEDELWTSKQRQASAIHEISYRACFKPQLPRYFIERFSEPGDTVYDPFTGRGTTIIEAALMGRRVVSNDVNPLSRILTEPRLLLPTLAEIEARLALLHLEDSETGAHNISMFYHPKTEAELVALRTYLSTRRAEGCEDTADKWIRMIATNRLTGHSPGFFSVYTLPPNQATSRERQLLINAKRNQSPDYRDIKKLILKKTRILLHDLDAGQCALVRSIGQTALFLEGDARDTSRIPAESVQLTVTSPPFLDIVQYSADNWLRCWFNCIDDKAVGRTITMSRTVDEWSAV